MHKLLPIILGFLMLGAASRSFDGNGDWLDMGTQINLGGGQAEVTIIAWVNQDSSGAANQEHTVWSNWNVGFNDAETLFRVEPSDDSLEGFVVDSTPATVGGSFTDVTVTANTWKHVVMRFDNTGSVGVETFVDSVKSGTNYGTANTLDTSNSTEGYIGCAPHDKANDCLTGRIAYFGLHGTALTDPEITNEMWLPYSTGLANSSSVQNAHVPCWGESPEEDLSGFSNNPVVTNATTSQDGPPVMFGGGLPL